MKIKAHTNQELKGLIKLNEESVSDGLPANNISDAVEYLLAFWKANKSNLYAKHYPKVTFKYGE